MESNIAVGILIGLSLVLLLVLFGEAFFGALSRWFGRLAVKAQAKADEWERQKEDE